MESSCKGKSENGNGNGKQKQNFRVSKRARERWNIVLNAIVGKDVLSTYDSRHKFSGFALFERERVQFLQEKEIFSKFYGNISEEELKSKFQIFKETFEICKYRHKASNKFFFIREKINSNIVTKEELSGFDNTGNIRIWPAEEILAHYCLMNSHLFKGKSICELASGASGLAGLVVAYACQASRVLITDGNQQASINATENLKYNEFLLNDEEKKGKEFRGQLLLWNRNEILNVPRFDFIIAADCLFLDEYHLDLLSVLSQLLKYDGSAFIFAPQRGNKLDLFLTRIKEFNENQKGNKKKFEIKRIQNYDDLVTEKHLLFSQIQKENSNFNHSYDPDVHYPELLKINFQNENK